MKRPGGSTKSRQKAAKRGPDFAAKLWNVAAPDSVIEPATEDAWARLERMVGVKFPANHRSILKRFGTGVFGGRLLMLNPSAEQDWRSEFSARWVHGVSSLLRGAFPQYNFDVASGGLIPIGMTADSVYLCLVPSTEPSASWSLRICSLHDRWTQAANQTPAEFLYRLASGEGRVSSAVKVKLWRSGETLFEPAPYLFH